MYQVTADYLIKSMYNHNQTTPNSILQMQSTSSVPPPEDGVCVIV